MRIYNTEGNLVDTDALSKIDHGGLAGLTDDDHPYVKESEFTAAEDILVGTGSGTLAKKTPAEVLAILSGDAGAAFDWNDQILQKIKGMLLTTATELTIDTDGEITVTQMVHTVDTFEDAASDDLVTINGGTTISLIIIRPANDGRTVVVKNATGNIVLRGGADITLNDITDHVMLFWDTTNSNWVGVGGGGGGLSDVVDDATPQLGGALDVNEKAIQDGDGDTKLQLEEGADDDHIRMDVGGTGGDNVFLLHDTGILDLPKQSAARVDRITSVFSVDSATLTNLDGNSEIYDIQNEYNSTTDVFTCTEAGIYLVEGVAFFVSLGNGKFGAIFIELNGSTVGTGQRANFSGGATNIAVAYSMPVLCAATDTLEVVLYHDHGSALNIYFGATYTHASFTKIT